MSDLLRLSVPLAAWLASFSAVYGLHGLVCSPRWAQAGLGPEAGRTALLLAAGAALALQVALLLAIRHPRLRSRSPWVQGVSLSLAVVALVATGWTLMPTAAATACL